MTIEFKAHISCDVPGCTNTIEVEAYVSSVGDEHEIGYDDPAGWLTHGSCHCPSCCERWIATQFDVGDRVKVRDYGAVFEGTIRAIDSLSLHRTYRIEADDGRIRTCCDWLMVKV